jgi:hypothetical protein
MKTILHLVLLCASLTALNAAEIPAPSPLLELIDAIYTANADRVEAILRTNKALVNQAGPGGVPALGVAVQAPRSWAALTNAFNLTSGASLQAFQAVLTNMVKMVESAGTAAPPLTESNSFSAQLAEYSRLFDTTSDEPGLAKAHLRIMELLLDAGADANTRAWGLDPVLHFAVQWTTPAAVKLLLDRGAELEAKGGPARRTALHLAIGHGRTATVELLLNRGANPKASDLSFREPMHYAAKLGDTNLVALLLARKANPDALDKDGLTPMVDACWAGQLGRR